MRTWALWCVDHRLKYVIYLVLILLFPVFLICGALAGILEITEEWIYEWQAVTRGIKYREKQNATTKD